ncbi:1-aminocyclopropane-1-carboxylate deaminase/D-cysteine desulfhydrase [uncultured Hymenobacter sp.]|uniref:1-aminocyclopropane-1-carboxylate deaminase/D-cysteine desulfhydrase n=1 Tax=uncultured Hymenobacter sp. TaxID=170016 RepID=UPI0035CAB7E2
MSGASILLQPISTPATERQGVQLWLWRDDLLNPVLPGNKARKLKYNLLTAKQQGQHTLLTFGGAYSNHLAAVAAAGRQQDFQTIGLVRGEESLPLNPTLSQCTANGMQLHFLTREHYRRRSEPDFLAELLAQFGPAYVLPEGGTNALALRGMAEIVADIRAHTDFDALAVPVGTGGTLAGVLLGLAGQGHAVGVATLKGAAGLPTEIDYLTQDAAGITYRNYNLLTGYHFGGYARYSAPLLAFIHEFEMQHGVLLDPIYTGKLLFGVLDLVAQGYFQPGSRVVAVHTGGLQAWAGWQARYGGRELEANS